MGSLRSRCFRPRHINRAALFHRMRSPSLPVTGLHTPSCSPIHPDTKEAHARLLCVLRAAAHAASLPLCSRVGSCVRSRVAGQHWQATLHRGYGLPDAAVPLGPWDRRDHAQDQVRDGRPAWRGVWRVPTLRRGTVCCGEAGCERSVAWKLLHVLVVTFQSQFQRCSSPHQTPKEREAWQECSCGVSAPSPRSNAAAQHARAAVGAERLARREPFECRRDAPAAQLHNKTSTRCRRGFRARAWHEQARRGPAQAQAGRRLLDGRNILARTVPCR